MWGGCASPEHYPCKLPLTELPTIQQPASQTSPARPIILSSKWLDVRKSVVDSYDVKANLLENFVSGFYDASPIGDIRYRQMMELQLTAEGRQVAPTFPLIDAQPYSETKLRPNGNDTI